MKTMTCKQLGGGCDKKFHANTFEEMAEISKTHGMKMFQRQAKDLLQGLLVCRTQQQVDAMYLNPQQNHQ